MSVLFDGDSGEVISGIDTGDIPASLRFRSAASASITRMFGTPTNNLKWKFAGGFKLGKVGSSDTQVFISAGTTAGDYAMVWWDGSTGKIRYTHNAGSVTVGAGSTDSVFRDPTSHMFLEFEYDSANATTADRFIVRANGVRQPFTFSTSLSLNRASIINSAVMHYIGERGYSSLPSDFYASRLCLTDNAIPSSTDFIRFNTDINEWVSKTQSEVKAVVDAGGANSFMLDFDNATSLTTLGYDKSSKGNNWTLNNFSLTAGVTYDHMLDVPGNSYATLNPINHISTYTMTQSDGNLKATNPNGSYYHHALASQWFDVTDPDGFYFEFDSLANYYSGGGITKQTNINSSIRALTNGGSAGYTWATILIGPNWYAYNNGAGSYGTAACTAASGTVFGCFVRGGKVWFRDSAGWITGDPNTDTSPLYSGLTGTYTACLTYETSGTGTGNINFGQRDFAYTKPTNALALCQSNLETPAILNPADHHIDLTVTKSGDTNFTLPWDASVYDTLFEIKRRDYSGDWYQIDGLRGYDKILKSNSTAAETTDANVLGVSGTTCTLKSTLANGTYVISATKAGLSASRQTNTDGSITSTVSRNVDSGFAIVKFNAGASASNKTVGHGLTVKPGMFVTRSTGSIADWAVWHQAFANQAQGVMVLNTTINLTNNSRIWANTAPSTSLISFEAGYTYALSGDCIAYCYADSAIQKSFSYTGNGSADGPNPFLGFKCGRSLFKAAGATSNWEVSDSARSTSNAATSRVAPNIPDAEDAMVGGVDYTSNSIKVKTTATAVNSSGVLHIGHAWASTTGKYSLAR